MKAELTAILEPAPEGGWWAMCAEIPGAHGQGKTAEEAKESLKAAVELKLEPVAASMTFSPTIPTLSMRTSCKPFDTLLGELKNARSSWAPYEGRHRHESLAALGQNAH